MSHCAINPSHQRSLSRPTPQLPANGDPFAGSALPAPVTAPIEEGPRGQPPSEATASSGLAEVRADLNDAPACEEKEQRGAHTAAACFGLRAAARLRESATRRAPAPPLSLRCYHEHPANLNQFPLFAANATGVADAGGVRRVPGERHNALSQRLSEAQSLSWCEAAVQMLSDARCCVNLALAVRCERIAGGKAASLWFRGRAIPRSCGYA